jgi:hypothetical protein
MKTPVLARKIIFIKQSTMGKTRTKLRTDLGTLKVSKLGWYGSPNPIFF